ncbi:MAG: ATP-binding protein [Bryobacteraceae bacterium]|jgi:signal transduction histidine kinase
MKKYASLRWRLAALIAGGSAVSAVIAAAGFSWLDLHRFWDHTGAEVAAIGNIVADQVGPAITLSDRKAANELLGSLRTDNLVRDAVLYSARGDCFAAFHRSAVRGCPARPSDGTRREAGALVLVRAVSAGGERLGTLVLAGSVPSMAAVLRQYLSGAVLIFALSLVVAAVVAVVLQSRVSSPILAMARVAERIAETHQFADRVTVASSDELGVLANSFNTMLEEIGRRDAELADRTQQLQDQVCAKERARAELAEAQQRLIDLSRQSGMAEIATSVLHNVGNVLNSVNVSATLVADKIRGSRVDKLITVVDMLQRHAGGIDEFLRHDPKGQRVLPYLAKLGSHLQEEHLVLVGELELLTNHVAHIKQIVASQQSYAKVSGLIERLSLSELTEDAVRILQSGLERQKIHLSRDFEDVPPVHSDKHQILQILLNLLRNAKQSIDEAGKPEKLIRVRIRRRGDDRVRLDVRDSGVGLASENLTRIFAHGFTTKADGHGFGLHSGALAAKRLGGSLWAESEGPGLGATFTLELPLSNELAETGRL